MCSEIASCSFLRDICRDVSGAEGFVRVKMSCESERLGYLANCGSEPMAAEPVAVGANVYMIPQGLIG